MKPTKLILLALCACLVLFATGCASVDMQKAPNADLSTIKSIYVVHLEPDGRGVNQVIADRLALLGYKSSTGPASETPTDVDAVITYEDKWMWDITMYMIELRVQLRDPSSNMMMASAKSYRPSLQRKSIDGMVEEVLGTLFEISQ